MRPPLDLDGLQIAFLGTALAHYLDLETGDILDLPLDAPEPDGSRYSRIPTRTEESEAEDRRLFVASLPHSPWRERLEAASTHAMRFRALLSEDRTVEKKWFSFKNDQATRAIDAWIREQGL